jgi:glycosyltransferase involved in cell wall biosynthesis
MMSHKIKGAVVYFAPVKKQFFEKWEYYQVDLEMLERCFETVIVCHSIWDFVKRIVFSPVRATYCWWWHQSVVCVIISRLLRIPVYVTGAVHMYDESGSPDFFSKGRLFRLACRISWRLASRNLFISQSQHRQICSHESVNNATVLKSSLSASYDVNSIEVEVKVDGDTKIRLLTIVWMTKDQLKRKSVYQTLDGLALLVQSGVRNVEWTIAGGSESGSDDLARKITELKLDEYVCLQLDISTTQKCVLYKNAHLYIQPSYYEGFGNAVLEAMSFGIPAVVSRNTAQAEVIGDAGFIVEEIDAVSIANVLSRYIGLSIKDRQLMRNKVYEVVSQRHLFDYRVEQFEHICKTDLI